DAAGQLIAVITPDGTTIIYTYDAAGNRTKVTVNRAVPDSTTALVPSTAGAGSTFAATIAGRGLASATSVAFSDSGIAATITGTPTDIMLTVNVVIGASVTPGRYPFT